MISAGEGVGFSTDLRGLVPLFTGVGDGDGVGVGVGVGFGLFLSNTL
jgi:hypothetical protein